MQPNKILNQLAEALEGNENVPTDNIFAEASWLNVNTISGPVLRVTTKEFSFEIKISEVKPAPVLQKGMRVHHKNWGLGTFKGYDHECYDEPVGGESHAPCSVLFDPSAHFDQWDTEDDRYKLVSRNLLTIIN